MMIPSIIATLTILLLLFLIYKCYVSPRIKIKNYKRFFQSKGFKVYSFPYKIFTYPIIQTIYKDSEKGDAFHSYKHIFNTYDVIIGNQLNVPSISLLSPQLRTQFAKVQRNYVYEKLKSFTSQQVRFAGHGLIYSEGDIWKRKRRIMGSLITYDLIKDNVIEIQEICKKTLKFIEQKVAKKSAQDQFEYDVGDLASICFSKIIICLFLGLKTEETLINNMPIGKFIVQFANQANMQAKGLLTLLFGVKFLDWGLTHSHRKINKKIKEFNAWVDNFIQNQINQRNKKKQNNEQQKEFSKDILSLHIKNSQTNLKAEVSSKNQDLYYKQELISQLKNFTIAGTETSATFFKMMVFYISNNPKVQTKLREQIAELQNQKELSYQSLKKYKYVQAIQKQTTRMFGPTNFNFPRRVLQDHYICGIPIYKNTIIQYHTVCTHYNPEYYDEPHQFKPQRWLDEKTDRNSALLIGFGLGPRNCIGQHLALIQSKIALIMFYRRYKSVKVEQNSIKFKWKFLYKPDSFNVKVKL